MRNIPKAGGISRCEVSCPAGENIRWTTYYIEKGNSMMPLRVSRSRTRFPEFAAGCVSIPAKRNALASLWMPEVATNALERAAFDYADPGEVKTPGKTAATGKKVAVVGAGQPA